MVPTEIRRRDPLRNFQFSIYVETSEPAWVCVAGVQKVSGLSSTVSPHETWEGGNNLHRYAQPDRVTWDPVTLEQGLALDDTLERWALGVRHFVMTGRPLEVASGGTKQIVKVKRNVVIEMWDTVRFDKSEAGQERPRVRRYRIHNAWISKYSALPRLDALASEVALATVELVHEGWTVDLPAPAAPAPTS
ncbi:phage tail protein [Sorangium sp. So ce341]|uniref:phage tail protein n=1 Tax=Sorangium sp. So ce341 TaxID=3133302 RepID=UPI003F615EBF